MPEGLPEATVAGAGAGQTKEGGAERGVGPPRPAGPLGHQFWMRRKLRAELWEWEGLDVAWCDITFSWMTLAGSLRWDCVCVRWGCTGAKAGWQGTARYSRRVAAKGWLGWTQQRWWDVVGFRVCYPGDPENLLREGRERCNLTACVLSRGRHETGRRWEKGKGAAHAWGMRSPGPAVNTKSGRDLWACADSCGEQIRDHLSPSKLGLHINQWSSWDRET